jgi:CubicO group peptidase (beta-lactamase class C family)
MLVEKIYGKPYPLALRELVINPLGITGLREVCQATDRAGYVIGYSPLDNTGPNLPQVPLGQPQWVNIDTADGNIGATADAMTRYLQYLIAVGRGRGAPLFSNTAAARFGAVSGPVAADIFGPGTAYASGLPSPLCCACSTSPPQQRSFDSTCLKLRRFLLDSIKASK